LHPNPRQGRQSGAARPLRSVTIGFKVTKIPFSGGVKGTLGVQKKKLFGLHKKRAQLPHGEEGKRGKIVDMGTERDGSMRGGGNLGSERQKGS